MLKNFQIMFMLREVLLLNSNNHNKVQLIRPRRLVKSLFRKFNNKLVNKKQVEKEYLFLLQLKIQPKAKELTPKKQVQEVVQMEELLPRMLITFHQHRKVNNKPKQLKLKLLPQLPLLLKQPLQYLLPQQIHFSILLILI